MLKGYLEITSQLNTRFNVTFHVVAGEWSDHGSLAHLCLTNSVLDFSLLTGGEMSSVPIGSDIINASKTWRNWLQVQNSSKSPLVQWAIIPENVCHHLSVAPALKTHVQHLHCDKLM